MKKRLSCSGCRGPIVAANKGGICQRCLSSERTLEYQNLVDLFLEHGLVDEVSKRTPFTAAKVRTILCHLRAAGHPIPRRRGGGGGWLDPIPEDRIVIGENDFERGKQVIRERTARRREIRGSRS